MLTNELQLDFFPEPMGLWVMNTSKYEVNVLDAMIKFASYALLEKCIKVADQAAQELS